MKASVVSKQQTTLLLEGIHMNAAKQARRNELMGLLGDLPPLSRKPGVRKIKEENCGNYILETLYLDLNGIEEVPAFFVKPAGMQGPMPAILYNHAHGGRYEIGKNELTQGRGALQQPPYAEVLTDMGYCALCIDAWAFGERRGRSESEIFKQMLWEGRVMWGMMVYDSLKAIDYLVSRPDVDAGRIGTIGISMGSTMAWWVAALDERVKVCVDICCLTDYEEFINTRGLDQHSIYYYVPSLLKHFTTVEINALIAPRPHLSLAGNFDKLTPPKGLDKIDAKLREVYAREGAPEAWKMVRYDIGHFETSAMRQEIIEFLSRWL
jgi:hypothetical protein